MFPKYFFLFFLLGHSLHATVIFVNHDATGANTGASWANAFTDLQDALGAAQSGDTIWVATGVYRPTSNTDRYISFEIPSGVALYGGFAGTESSLAARDWLANYTVLSGDIGTPTDSLDNTYRVIRLSNVNNITLDGFTVTAGYNNNPVPSLTGRSGAGMHLSNARCSLYNMTFIGNTARFGGAIGLWSNSELAAENCLFQQNTSNGSNDRCGGAILAEDEFLNCSYLNCRFVRNRVLYVGGAGGAVSGGANTFINCVFSNNSAAFGSAIASSNASIYQSSFGGNQDNFGLLSNGNYQAFNSIFWLNINSTTLYESVATLSACLLKEGQCPDGASCENATMIYNKDPYFTDPRNGDFSLSLCSPAIDAGVNADIPAFLVEDVTGLSRVINGVVDMGAYEFLDLEPQYRPTDVRNTDGNFASRSLAGAIICANAHPGPDTIRFVLPGAAPHLIYPTYTLPALTDGGSVIDASDFPLGDIRLDGSQLVPTFPTQVFSGLAFHGTGIEVYGLDIRNFSEAGIYMSASSDAARIGAPGKGNILWGNHYGNIRLQGSGHTIQSNYIGVTPEGLVPPAGAEGIKFYSAFNPEFKIHDIQVGGSRIAGEGNVFGGLSSGLSSPDLSNYVDTAYDIRIEGNYFGANPDETGVFPNGSALRLYAENFQFKSVHFGGSSLDKGNVIAYNNTGIVLEQYTTEVAINHNKFYCNDNGILLYQAGNAGIQPPVITTADIFQISGTALPGQSIELYLSDNTNCPDSAACQGTTYLGEVIADASGYWLLGNFQQQLFGGEQVTATATSSIPVTSEFAPCAVVVCPESFGSLNQTLCANESLLINGTAYDVNHPSGTEVLIDASAIGCDSILSVNLSFLPLPQGAYGASLCEGDSLVLGDLVFNIQNPSGLVTLPGAGANGCDSLVMVSLDFLPRSIVTIDTAICTGDTIWIGENPVMAAGQYTFSYQAANGCDSIVNLSLGLLPLPTRQISASICSGEVFEFQGQALAASGLYEAAIPAPSGCDSLLVLNLEVAPVYATTLSAGFCEGDSYAFCDNLLDAPGTYLCELQSIAGCDSTLTLELQLLSPSEGFVDTILCPGEPLLAGDTLIDQAGEYQLLLTNVAGCDSTLNLNLAYSRFDAPAAEIEPDLGFGNGAIRLSLDGLPLELSWEDNSADTVRSGLHAGSYRLMLTDSLGCEYVFTYEVPEGALYLETPNAFTPNGDGDNDYFNFLSNTPDLHARSFKVFNRWGQLVYDNEATDVGWDGNFQGQPQPADTYFFIMEVGVDYSLEGTKVLRGDVTLLR